MPIPDRFARPIIYLLVFFSGSAGLIYQVAWHKYLAILLGAQARATVIVIAIFLGGISLGYWTFGRWTRWKRWNLLFVYCVIEACLGFWAFLFPYCFKFSMFLVPKIYGLLGIQNILIDIVFSIFLIGLPTFLMGGTLPLLTQGLSEDISKASKTHARIYGYNTLGACLGCLLAGYYLIPQFNLPLTVLVGGFLNISISLIFYFLFARWIEPQEVVLSVGINTSDRTFSPSQLFLLGIGFLSGFYTIALETILIRLMGLSTGSSNYNFTLIVSIFILALGIGSIVVRSIENYRPQRIFWNQLWVAFGLFLIYLSGDYWPYWVHLIRAALRDIPQNFFLFQFLLGLGFISLLIIPIGFCGFTLPLCFHLIKDHKESLGQRVGQLYGSNTVGSVAGALLGGYFFLYLLDLDHLFKLCIFLSLITVLLSVFLFKKEFLQSRVAITFGGTLFVFTLVGVLLAPSYHRDRNIQPFRQAAVLDNVTYKGVKAFGKYLARHTKLIFWKDDPNTSVGIGATIYDNKEVSRTILINGKSDGNTRGDFLTTLLLGHIPALLSEKLTKACIIGFGTGVTIGTVNLYPELERIDVLEISHILTKNVHYFDKYNGSVSTSPKLKIHEMDAFRYLEGTREKYDLIISEPSNPWVAGIENLYSLEFYRMIKHRLNEHGLIAQWIHTYSFSNDLFRMILRTMTEEFKYVSVFQLKGGDYVLVGRVSPFTREDTERAAKRLSSIPAVSASLLPVGIDRIESLFALEVVPAAATQYIAGTAKIHRLESPKLSNLAAKAFFVGSSADILSLRKGHREYFALLDQSLLSLYLGNKPLSSDSLMKLRELFCDLPQSKINTLCEESLVATKMQNLQYIPENKYFNLVPLRDLASFSQFYSGTGLKFTKEHLREVSQLLDTYKKYASPIAKIPIQNLLSQVEQCLLKTKYEDELWGECLLQKILIMESTFLPSPEFNSYIEQYVEWFPKLGKNSQNHSKLEEARNILVDMLKKNPGK